MGTTPRACQGVMFGEDDDRWTTAECTCGAFAGPFPDQEDAADWYGDHRASVTASALRALVEATGRLAAGDASTDVLFGVLDMRTRACHVLGIDAGSD